MSQKDIQALIEKMKLDPEFKKNIFSFDNVDDRMSYIAQEGFNITAHDLKSMLEEVSQEELDQISGGGRCLGHSCWW